MEFEMTLKEETEQINRDSERIKGVRIQMEAELTSPHEELLMHRGGFTEKAFLALCEEVGIDPDAVSEYARERLDCLCDSPSGQRELLEEILSEIGEDA